MNELLHMYVQRTILYILQRQEGSRYCCIGYKFRLVLSSLIYKEGYRSSSL